jgi:hypothetical protein
MFYRFAKECDMRLLIAGIALTALMANQAYAAETITYAYDAKGRLRQVTRSGTVNNGVQTTYGHDKANNRKTLTTTGSPN